MKRSLLPGLIGLSTLVSATFFQANPASAGSISYNLNCVISGKLNTTTYTGGSTCADVSPTTFGTLTMTDGTGSNTGKVLLNLNLTGTQNKILGFSLNYDDAKFSNSNSFTLTGTTVTDDKNAIKADGYGGRLDLDIPSNGNLGATDTFSGYLAVANGSLNINDLKFLDTLGNIYSAVHIGDYGGSPGVTGTDSIWVGAAPPKPIPTPSLLFGAVLMGLKVLTKKNDSQSDDLDAQNG